MIEKYKKITALFGVIFITAAWGSTFVVVKESLNGINPLVLVGYRFAVASIILILYLFYKKKNIFQNLKEGAVLGVFMWGMYISQTIGLMYTKASNSGFITGMYILFIPLLNLIIFRKRFQKIKIISIVFSLLGIYFLTGGIKSFNKGDFLTFITAGFCALHILAADCYMKKDRDIFVITFQQFALTLILSFVLSLTIGYDFSIGDIKVAKSILYLAIFPTVLAFVIQMYAQKYMSPFKIGALFALEPIFALIMAVQFGSEILTINSVFGGILIVAGIILSEIKWRE